MLNHISSLLSSGNEEEQLIRGYKRAERIVTSKETKRILVLAYYYILLQSLISSSSYSTLPTTKPFLTLSSCFSISIRLRASCFSSSSLRFLATRSAAAFAARRSKASSFSSGFVVGVGVVVATADAAAVPAFESSVLLVVKSPSPSPPLDDDGLFGDALGPC